MRQQRIVSAYVCRRNELVSLVGHIVLFDTASVCPDICPGKACRVSVVALQDIFVTALMSMFAFVSMIGGIFGERLATVCLASILFCQIHVIHCWPFNWPLP